ncbi:2-hydroxyacid dehydrogenase [Comamonas endophytica]|uniref:2-hydroxyacid dehydrogenase n=1 Tax=Comamonas endophytica TaxID=2949090 RepID=A0ABY6G6J7_9BURK|nr:MULTISPECIES: 2-hydroxyacid dehydrogenase [unclassified Acidovorax]MCD2511123.1 2-hydroxyacid dehydrogenase [Acidovorax sp. D4N7]UYG50526.1 2-hydroxyacid dehydrogenase [Acidovorax sp. 5MLIR]
MKPVLLALSFLSPEHRAQVARAFPTLELVYQPDIAQWAEAIAAHGPRVQVVMTIGTLGLSAGQMQAMPGLKLICTLGVGYENVDIKHAHAHGILVGNGAGTNDESVADHAMGLMLASLRGIVRLDRLTREGVWRTALPLPPQLSHKRLGIVGMGTIGKRIAQRALGFEMEIGYHNRRERSDVAHRYFGDVHALAAWCDVLLIATPGGPETRHLVNAEVLDALGPDGHLVNIARGSVVDTAALADAIRAGRIAGAGLDVYESEPKPPAELLDLDKVVLTPHVAGWSPEAVQAAVDRFVANVRCYLEGRALVSPV